MYLHPLLKPLKKAHWVTHDNVSLKKKKRQII